MNFNTISNKTSRKRKYDNFCGNFQVVSSFSSTKRPTVHSIRNSLANENKRLKSEIYCLKQQIKELETKLELMYLENKNEEIPCELEMFYYI